MIFNKTETKKIEFEYKFIVNNRPNGRTRIELILQCNEYGLSKTKFITACTTSNKKELYSCLKEVDDMEMSKIYDLAKKMIDDYKLEKRVDLELEFMIKKVENKNGKFEINVD